MEVPCHLSVASLCEAGGPKVVANVELALDMLCYAPREKVDGQSVTGSFLSGIISQLSAAQSLLQAQLHCRRIAALHFQPDGCNHPMTFLYPEPTDVSHPFSHSACI